MPYFQLNNRPLPATAAPAVLFPFVYVANESGSDVGRLALLVSETNALAGAMLVRAGFRKDETTALPSGFGLDVSWRFYHCGSTGPFLAQPWTVDAGDADARMYGDNLTLTLPAAPNNVDRPTTILVRTANAVAGDFSANAAAPYFRLPFALDGNGNPAGWTLRFAESDNTTDDPRVDFGLPIRSLRDQAGTIPYVEFSLRLVSRPNTTGEDPGVTLEIDDAGTQNVAIDGGQADRLSLEGGALVGLYDGTEQKIVYEYQPTATLTLPAGLAGRAKLTLDPTGICLRFEDDAVGLYLYPDAAGGPVELRMRIAFSLIMQERNNPDARAFLLSLAGKSGTEPPQLEYVFQVPVGSEWDYERAVIVWNAVDAWLFSTDWLDMAVHWPIVAKPRSKPCALPGLDFPLKDLLGDFLGGAESLVRFALLPQTFGDTGPLRIETAGSARFITVTLGLQVDIVGEPLIVSLDLKLNLRTFRLQADDLSYRLPASPHGDGFQVIDLKFFALLLPNQPSEDPVEHGILDFEAPNFVLNSATNSPPALLVFPGNLSTGSLDNRFIFHLAPPPDSDDREKLAWPAAMLFRLGSGGISVSAKIDTSHAAVAFPGNDLIPPIKIKPLSEREGVRSEFVLVDNAIRRAVIACEMDVPATDDLIAQVELGMRQTIRGRPPEIYANVSVRRPSGKPIAQLSAGYLQLSIDEDGIRNWRLTWDMATGKWKLSLPTNGSIALAPRTSETGGLDDLTKDNAIKFTQLDLMNLHRGAGSIELPLSKPVRFNCLDGLFAVTLRGLGFQWGDTFVLSCASAEFRFTQAGQFDIDIKTGAIRLEFSGGRRVKMRMPAKLIVDARIGEATRIRGLIEWRDDGKARYFGIGGTLEMTGLPHASCGVTVGSITKRNGQKAALVSIYGEADYQMTLFSGVVARRFGVGAGINRRLVGIDDTPNAEELLERIDTLRLDNWEDVDRNGVYVTIVGTVLLSSNPGNNTDINAYVASLLLCIDSDLNVMAAGKLWLYCSVGYVLKPDNFSRPALVGAVVVSPKQQLITAAVESRRNAAVEGNDQLARILKNGHLRFSFLLSPALVDFFLQDLSYQDEFFGVQMLFRGSIRFAIFQGVVLLRATYSLTGSFAANVEESSGGLNGGAELAARLDYGGLISQGGLIAYGGIDLSIPARARLWTKIEFSVTIRFGRRKWRRSWSKTFTLASARFELGLAGNVGFNTSGQIGFDGRLSVSVPICGYRLSISPSFSFNDGVIADARSQVAAFEQRIEAYRQELLGGNTARRALLTEPFSAHELEGVAAPETWLLYRIGNWCLLLPRDDEAWVTPHAVSDPAADPFANHVTAIELRDSSSDDLIRRVRMPWDARITDDELPADLQQYREEIEGSLLETADADSPPSLRTYEVHQDPRLRSTSRAYWTDEDQATLPDTALPIRLRPVEEILTGDRLPRTVDSDFAELVEYMYWRNRGRRFERHAGGDTTPAQQALKNRAALIQFWLQELRNAPENPTDDLDGFLWVARQVRTHLDAADVSDDALRVGLIFDLPAALDLSQVAFTVYRDPDPDTAVSLTVREATSNDEVKTLRALLKPESIRQEFVVDQAGQELGQGELGRVVVKLPVFFDKQYFEKGGLETFSHFQVWRKMPWEDRPRPLADFVRPGLTALEEGGRQALVVGNYVLTDSFPVESRQLDRDLAGRAGVRYFLRPIKVAQLGDDDYSAASLAFRPFPPLFPYVSPVDAFPKQLTMAMSFQSLVPGSPEHGRFTLLTVVENSSAGGTATTRTAPATLPQLNQPPRLLAPEDFELYLENFPISESGFFGGQDDADDGGAAAPPVLLESLDEVSRADRGRSPMGKTKLKFRRVAGQEAGREVWFEIIDPPVQLGRAYRFFVRPLVRRPDAPPDEPSTAVGLLRAVDHALTREQPLAGVAPRTLRPVSNFEWIAPALIQSVRSGTLDEIPIEVTCRGAESIGDLTAVRNRLGLEWRASGEHLGGVELLVRDVDDSGLSETMLCEILRHDVFRISQLDFRDPARWIPTPLEVSARPTLPAVPDAVWDVGGPHYPALSDYLAAREDFVAKQYLYADPNGELIDNVRIRTQAVLDIIRPTSGTFPDWMVSWPALKNWLTAVFDFEKTPLNLNDAPLSLVRLQLKTLARWFFLGITVSAADLSQLTTAALRQVDSDLNALLREFEVPPDVSSMPADTDEEQLAIRRVLVDADLARQLGGIVRRRHACAEELFSPDDDRLPDAGSSEESWLPAGDRFEALRLDVARLAIDLQGGFTRCARLLAWFPVDVAQDPRPHPVCKRLLEVVDRFQQLALPERIRLDPARRLKAIPCVLRAGGLTQALNQLADRLEPHGERLVRRPHHQAAIGTNNEGERTAVEVKLSELVPDEGRDTSPGSLVMHYANVLERLGFALDIAVLDPLTKPLSQIALLQRIRDAGLPALFPEDDNGSEILAEHRVFVLAGREPDSEYRDEDLTSNSNYVGYSFVKLCVVPELFHQLLTSRLVEFPTDSNDTKQKVTENLAELGELWFKLRKVDVGAGAAPLLMRLGHAARYATFGQTDLAAVGHLRLVSQDRRWVSVPHVGRRSHVEWSLPDQFGHRIYALGRLVSRYEPLIRWAERSHRPTAWPTPIVRPAGLTEGVLVPRLISRIDQPDLPEALPISIHPHPERVQFSLILPSAGARSLMNVISAVRTGYQGYSLVFQYKLRDHEDEKRPWDKVLRAMEYLDDAIQDAPAVLKQTPGVAFADIRLFRNERLITLEDLPYFFEYWLVARSHYDAQRLLTAPAPAPVGDAGLVATARRSPSLIAVRVPEVRKTPAAGDEFDYEVTVYLNRTGDLLTPRQWASSPPLVPIDVDLVDGASGTTEHLSIPPDRLPEPSCAYIFVYSLNPGPNDVYERICELRLPWHDEYELPADENEPPHPYFHRVAHVTVADEDRYPPIVCGHSEHEQGGDNLMPTYRVTLKFKCRASAPVLSDLSRFRCFVTRAGQSSPVIPVKVLT